MTANDLARVNSLDIAKTWKKTHSEVLADIRLMLKELELDASEFEGVWRDGENHDVSCFWLPLREVNVLVFGYMSVPIRAGLIDKLCNSESKTSESMSDDEGELTIVARSARNSEGTENNHAADSDENGLRNIESPDYLHSLLRHSRAEMDMIKKYYFSTPPRFRYISADEAAGLRYLCRHEAKIRGLPQLELDIFKKCGSDDADPDLDYRVNFISSGDWFLDNKSNCDSILNAEASHKLSAAKSIIAGSDLTSERNLSNFAAPETKGIDAIEFLALKSDWELQMIESGLYHPLEDDKSLSTDQSIALRLFCRKAAKTAGEPGLETMMLERSLHFSRSEFDRTIKQVICGDWEAEIAKCWLEDSGGAMRTWEEKPVSEAHC